MATDVPDFTTETQISNTVNVVASGTVAVSSVGGTVNVTGNVTASGTVAVSSVAGNVNVTGAVNITAGNITVLAGQNGVNVSTDSPPVNLGSSTMAIGTKQKIQNFTIPANATGLLIVCPAPTSLTGNDFPTLTINPIPGGAPRSFGAKEFPNLSVPLGISWVAGGGVMSVQVDWLGNAASNSTAATVYAITGAGITEVVAENPVPLTVQLTDAANVVSANTGHIAATGTGAGGGVLVNVPISNSALRYLRYISLQADVNGTGSTTGVTLTLKGHTTASTMSIIVGVLTGANHGWVIERDYNHSPLDLALIFPGDTSVDIIISAAANTGWAVNGLITA